MDAKAREELVGVVASLLGKIIGGCGYFTDAARAALAVIEPVVREECAKVADAEARTHAYTTGRQYESVEYLEKCDAKEEVADDIAAAIRGGSNGG